MAEASTLRICETVRLNSVNLPIGSLDTDRELDRETWLGRGVAEASTLQICETVSTLNKRVVFLWLSRSRMTLPDLPFLPVLPARVPQTTMRRRGNMFEPSVSGA